MRTRLLAFALLLLAACSGRKDSYTLGTGQVRTTYEVAGREIASLWERELGIVMALDSFSTSGPIQNCCKLVKGELDFALLHGDVSLEECGLSSTRNSPVRTLMPLYPQLLYVLYYDSTGAVPPQNLRQLVQNQVLALGPDGSAQATLALHVLSEFGLTAMDFTPRFMPNYQMELSPELPIAFLLASHDDTQVKRLLAQPGVHLFSLDNYRMMGQGSTVDGLQLRDPHVHPYLLPRNSFGDKPELPVLTVAVDAILAVHEDISADLAYELTRVLHENQQDLANENLVFAELGENFDVHSLDFPLHPGAIQYYERNKPTFFERYAEVIALIFTISAFMYGGITGINNWISRRKKDRIDKFYGHVLEIETRSNDFTKVEQFEDAIDEIVALKRDAYQKLVEEKLASDGSFAIFESLATNNINTLRYKKQRMLGTSRTTPPEL